MVQGVKGAKIAATSELNELYRENLVNGYLYMHCPDFPKLVATLLNNSVSKSRVSSFTAQIMQKFFRLLSLVFIGFGCVEPTDSPPNGVDFTGTGYRPIYSSPDELARIQIAGAQPLAQPGKIYLFDPYIFINELGKGIHIIDNKDPKNPKNLSFIAITGNYDIAVKGNWLYADNVSNLLVFDITDPLSPKLSKTIADAIPYNNFPPFQNVYFECVDTKKGIVSGWEKVPMSAQPKCFR
jgi:hypothetical protein